MVKIDNVTKRYPTRHGGITVLDGINLRVAPGEKVGILGRNGAGKSTLIRLVSGAERPTTGNITRTMKCLMAACLRRRVPGFAHRPRQSALHLSCLRRER